MGLGYNCVLILGLIPFNISFVFPCFSVLFFSLASVVFTDYVIPSQTLLLRYYDVTRQLRASDYITDYLKSKK